MREMLASKVWSAVIVALCVHSGTTEAQEGHGTPGAIATVADLKRTLSPASFHEVVRSTASWLPRLVAATPWQVRLSDHFVFHYYGDVPGAGDSRLDSLVVSSEQMYEELLRFFEIESRSKQDSIALQSRLACFVVDTDGKTTFGLMPHPHLLFFYLDAQKTPGYLSKLRHEYAHWVWGRLYGEAPSLFWEGVATYGERASGVPAGVAQVQPAGFEVDQIPPLQEATVNEIFWQHKGMYTAGSLLVEFLVRERGWEPLKQLFLLSEFEDPRIEEHFRLVYGRSLGEVDAQWRIFAATAANRGNE